MGQLVEVQVPDIGDFKDVEVIEVLVKAGDTVSKEQSLITVESDKASMEIPSSAAGVVKELRVKLGDKVSQGSSLAVVESADGKAAPARAPAPPAKSAASVPPRTIERAVTRQGACTGSRGLACRGDRSGRARHR